MSSKRNIKNESELAVRNGDKRNLAKGKAAVRPLIERGVLEDRAGHCLEDRTWVLW